MKASVLLAFIFFFIINISSGQYKIKQLEINEIGYKSRVKLIPIKDSISNQEVSFIITPINPLLLNNKFTFYNYLNGKFNFSYYTSSPNIFLKQKKYIKQEEKSLGENYLANNVWLFKQNIISDIEYHKIYNKILERFYPEILEKSKYKTTSCNPFFLNDFYLSVFKIRISNNSNSDKTILRSGISIINGYEMLKPLSNESVINELINHKAMTNEKSISLKRFNLPEKLLIPANTSVEFYFSVLPIYYSDKQLKISIAGLNEMLKWKIEKESINIKSKIIFYEFDTDADDLKSSFFINTDNFFYVINKSSDTCMSINNNIYINKVALQDTINLFTFGKYKNKFYYGRRQIVGENYIQKDKNKRKVIEIELFEIKK